MNNNLEESIYLELDINPKFEFVINIVLVIIGIIIGILFGYLVFNKNIYVGPDSNDISSKIYEDSRGKKYKWKPKICICPINLSMDKLKNNNYKNPKH